MNHESNCCHNRKEILFSNKYQKTNNFHRKTDMSDLLNEKKIPLLSRNHINCHQRYKNILQIGLNIDAIKKYNSINLSNTPINKVRNDIDYGYKINSENRIKNEKNKTNNSIRLSKTPIKKITNDINYDQRYKINSQSGLNNNTNSTNNRIRLSYTPIKKERNSINYDYRYKINEESRLNNEKNKTNNSIRLSKTPINNIKTNLNVRRIVNYEDKTNPTLTHTNKYYYKNVIIHDRSKDKNYNNHSIHFVKIINGKENKEGCNKKRVIAIKRKKN